MKCWLNEKKSLKVMLMVGLALMALGGIERDMLPEEMHLVTRIADYVSGAGSSLALIAGVMFLRNYRLGEAGAKDAALEMNDERGLTVAYKAQNVAAIAAVIALIGVSVLALARGDEFYAVVCGVLLLAVALVKLIAWHVYNRSM